METAKKRELQRIAYELRKMTLEMVRRANSGHIGGSFSLAEILSVLYFDWLHIDPARPRMPERDRLILSKGHCSPALYAALAKRGYFPQEELSGFRSLDSRLSGHVEMNHIPGVDMSTGSLGQGLSVGVGMALSARAYGQDFRTYVILGDGELQEGQVWEAAMAAGNYRLDRLTAIVDRNRLQLDGGTEEIMPLEPLSDKFRAFHWHVVGVDGHEVGELEDALRAADEERARPTVMIADTVKGKGVSAFENQIRFHGGRPTAEEYGIAFTELERHIREWEG